MVLQSVDFIYNNGLCVNEMANWANLWGDQKVRKVMIFVVNINGFFDFCGIFRLSKNGKKNKLCLFYIVTKWQMQNTSYAIP